MLAVLSIKYQYTGALACWTVVFTPIGTALSIVLSRIVEKNRAENTSANGEGVKYAAAQAAGFCPGLYQQRKQPSDMMTAPVTLIGATGAFLYAAYTGQKRP